VARELGETSIMFLVHPTLTDEEMDKTCRAIGEVLAMAGPAR
jgi:dTDP-4-amino-4,6-dideoxygalactose transaminase